VGQSGLGPLLGSRFQLLSNEESLSQPMLGDSWAYSEEKGAGLHGPAQLISEGNFFGKALVMSSSNKMDIESRPHKGKYSTENLNLALVPVEVSVGKQKDLEEVRASHLRSAVVPNQKLKGLKGDLRRWNKEAVRQHICRKQETGR